MKPTPEWLERAALPNPVHPRRKFEAPLGTLRLTGHVLAVAAGWVLFAWGWQRVVAGQFETGQLRALLGWSLLIVPMLTLAWVAHNVGIHRRKGPRRAVPAVTARHDVDFNGRAVVADWPRLCHQARVDIVLEGAQKHFIGHGEPGAVVPCAIRASLEVVA